MLNYHSIRLYNAILLFSMIVIRIFYTFSWWWILLAPIIYTSFLIYGSIKIQANFFIESIHEAKTDNRQVALTFDDGPIIKNTSIILDILKRNRIAATFFCIGNKIEKHPLLVQQIHREGHIIGNHSYSHHIFFDLKSLKEMQNELKQTDILINQNIDNTPRLFRPPYGVTNPNLAKAVSIGNYHSIGWSVRSMDTVVKTEQELLSNITGNIKSGDIILLHDSADITVHNLQKIIDDIRNSGFEIVRLDKLLNIEAYA